MRALTVIPGRSDSLAVEDMPAPDTALGDVLVDGVAVGVCGTDHELSQGDYGWAPEGSERLILGHESLGRVREAPDGSGFAAGDLIVGVVRMPDPKPCGACAHGEWDMCRNGEYTEHGIKSLHGFAAEQWRVRSEHAVKLDQALESVGMLMEPTTVVAKAWEQVDRIGGRAWFEPKSVLITGAGPIGLLAAMIGAQRGLDVHVLDRVNDGPKPQLVEDLGARYHSEPADKVIDEIQPDVIIEGTGATPVVNAVLANPKPYAITILTGISDPGETETVDLGTINRTAVLGNSAVAGSVNANLRHYEAAAEALAAADLGWLERLVTRRVPLEKFAEAFTPQDDDVKVVLTL
ncbi:threonine dehydrogenase [Flexivirga endophytica]|uniref:Threonine dehydrogenase n=1 Tax=Flexivirga endophytica TaxID=1849103 RepID=A0A916T7F4_9MICO|nr:glucose 1-dehydrogenase [Flexivirga endophytica]GGB34456.1 threonine dehydrogenase [Flexivirga endophytica]GHB42397.1 threonine dehydrogenase [Flexivirga endophytica]